MLYTVTFIYLDTVAMVIYHFDKMYAAAVREIGLEVNADKTKYMVMS